MPSTRKERPKTRDLIRWDNDKDIQILLSIVKNCAVQSIKLPWEDIGRDIGPKVTGNAVIQHLTKLKKKTESRRERTGSKEGGRQHSRQQRNSVTAENTGTKVEDDDQHSDYDVDKATDPDDSFGESRAKSRLRKVQGGNKKGKATTQRKASRKEIGLTSAIKRPPSSQQAGNASKRLRADTDDSPSLSTPEVSPKLEEATVQSQMDEEQFVAANSQFLHYEHLEGDEDSAMDTSSRSRSAEHMQDDTSETHELPQTKLVRLTLPPAMLQEFAPGASPMTTAQGLSMPNGTSPFLNGFHDGSLTGYSNHLPHMQPQTTHIGVSPFGPLDHEQGTTFYNTYQPGMVGDLVLPSVQNPLFFHQNNHHDYY